MSAATIPCELCGRPTPMLGTKRCDRCYELEGRIHDDPQLARKILAAMPQHTDAAPSKPPLSAKDVIVRLCMLQEEVSAHLDQYQHAADCFCGTGGFWRSDSYGGTFEQGYRNQGKSIEFIENAVRAAIAEGRR